MDRPCYRERVNALAAILDELPAPERSSTKFAVPGNSDHVRAKLDRGQKLDQLLVRLWDGAYSDDHASELDLAEFADTNHLRRSDFGSLGTVGEGQFGTVEAVQLDNSDVYALKTIRKDIALRNRTHLRLPLERHVHLLATIQPSPIPALVAAFQDRDHYYLLTPYAPFGSLWDRMCALSARRGVNHQSTDKLAPMPEDEIRWWAPQMVDAIAWLHLKGYVHRDIKPQNFLLFADAHLQLTDLGSAAPLSPTPGLNPSSQIVPLPYCGVPVGTPDYIAPEILQLAEDLLQVSISDAPVPPGIEYGPSVDWWSLGVVLYEMMMGQTPFWKPTVAETYQEILGVQSGHGAVQPQGAGDLVDLVSRLLRPESGRLGRDGSLSVMDHSVFTGVDWTTLTSRQPPDSMPTLQPTELSPVSASMSGTSQGESTFGLFDSFSTTSTFQPHTRAVRASVPGFHSTNWSFEPMPSNLVPSDVQSPLAAGMVTPSRPTSRHTPSTIPKSAPRRRPMSREDATHEIDAMLQCVTASVKKRSDYQSGARVLHGSKSRQEEMEVWHHSISENLTRLDHRLAHLQGMNNAGRT